MNFVAWKMLTGDRAKYLGLIFTIAFWHVPPGEPEFDLCRDVDNHLFWTFPK